jgi:hypothetical protein
MGIRSEEITEAMMRLAPELRKLRANVRNATEACVLEREEQAKLAAWLCDQKRLGRLQYDWSATHRKATRRIGMPDFSVWANGQALLGEMKQRGAKLRPEQALVHVEFWRSGTPVSIWYSASEAIDCIKAWLRSLGV